VSHAVLHRWKVRGGKEDDFAAAWARLTDVMIELGCYGARLHRGEDGGYIAYSWWPSKQTWEAAQLQKSEFLKTGGTIIETRHELRGGLPTPRIHPHVEGADSLVAEAAIGVVQLHRRHPQVHEDEIGGREPLGGQHLRQPRKRAVMGDKRLGPEAGGAQSCLRAGQLERIHVEPDEASARLQASQDRLGVSPTTERAVHHDVAGPGSKAAKDFLHHDRPVHARRRLAGIEDLLHVRGVPLGVELLVFVVEPARVFARVSRPPPVHGRCVRGLGHHAEL